MEGRHTKTAEVPETTAYPSLFSAFRRYPWTIVVFLAGFVALGFVLDRLTPEAFEATAAIIVEDPRSSTPFELDGTRLSNQDSERYLADQVEILRSSAAAEAASIILADDMKPSAILDGRDVVGDLGSNLIEITYRDGDPERAARVANALASAYFETRRATLQQSADEAIAQIDKLIVEIDAQLADVRAQIRSIRTEDAGLTQLERQFDAALASLNELRTARDAAPILSLERAQLNDQIDELLRDFQTWSVILNTDRVDPDLTVLTNTEDQLTTRRADLVKQRESIAGNVELIANRVVLFSPAPVPNESVGLGLGLILAIMGALGLSSAAAAAFYLALHHRIVDRPLQPESLLGAPILTEIPAFGRDPLPVISDPTSRAAEAFRFASTAIDIRTKLQNARSVLFVPGSQKIDATLYVANTSLAAVGAGLRVLAVDAEFATQDLTRLLGGRDDVGISDVVAGVVPLGQAIQTVEFASRQGLQLLSRGGRATSSPGEPRTDEAGDLFGDLPENYDLILVDGPSLLESAYASTVARQIDGAVVLVEHGGDWEALEQVVDRLELIGSEILGYLYLRESARPQPVNRGELEPRVEAAPSRA